MDDYPASQIMKHSSMLPVPSPQESKPVQVRKLVALTKLQSFYYQAGQTKLQIEGMLEDMLSDLSQFTAFQVEDACAAYRRDGANKFFPTSGQLMDATKEKPSVPHSNLKRYDPKEFDAPRAGTLKPVWYILREHGHEAAARKWEAS